MSTTTLRLSEDLKAKIAAVAERAGTTPHNYMVAAIAENVGQAELRAAFSDTADARMMKLLTSGRGLDWRDMQAYLADRAKGRSGKAPKPRSWRK